MFRIGDVVECLDSKNTKHCLEEGVKYYVTGLEGVYIYVSDGVDELLYNGRAARFFATRFRLVSHAAKPHHRKCILIWRKTYADGM